MGLPLADGLLLGEALGKGELLGFAGADDVFGCGCGRTGPALVDVGLL